MTMPCIRISVETQTWETRPADPTDEWDCGDEAGRVSDVYALYIGDKEPDDITYRSEDFPAIARPGQYIYVVVVDYESGNTFGRAGGYYQVLDIFRSIEEASELALAAERVQRGDMSFQFSFKDQTYYVSWTGYFESLNEVKVWCVMVK